MTQNFEDLWAPELKRKGIPTKYFAAQMRRGMSPESIVAAFPERRLSTRVGSRRFRRRLLVGIYAGWLLVAAYVKVASSASPGSSQPFGVLLLANAMFQAIWFVWLGQRTYVNAPQVADSDLDERLVQVKNQAFRRAFQVFVPVALIGWVVSLLAVTSQPNHDGLINSQILFFGVALLATTLPTAIVAWREPDPKPDEDESA
jgi:uncharacterized membrane protein